MNGTAINAVAQRSRQAIAEAMLAAVRERPYEEITVTDICSAPMSCVKHFIIISVPKTT
jgi:AcrR family transcriptional regulator